MFNNINCLGIPCCKSVASLAAGPRRIPRGRLNNKAANRNWDVDLAWTAFIRTAMIRRARRNKQRHVGVIKKVPGGGKPPG